MFLLVSETLPQNRGNSSECILKFSPVTNDNSSPEIRPNKGRNAANNTLMKKLSYSDVSPKEQMLSQANLKVVSITLPWKQLHV